MPFDDEHWSVEWREEGEELCRWFAWEEDAEAFQNELLFDYDIPSDLAFKGEVILTTVRPADVHIMKSEDEADHSRQ